MPVGQTYAAGDYLAMRVFISTYFILGRLISHPSSLPVNPIRDVKRVLSRFKLPAEQEVRRKPLPRSWTH